LSAAKVLVQYVRPVAVIAFADGGEHSLLANFVSVPVGVKGGPSTFDALASATSVFLLINSFSPTDPGEPWFSEDTQKIIKRIKCNGDVFRNFADIINSHVRTGSITAYRSGARSSPARGRIASASALSRGHAKHRAPGGPSPPNGAERPPGLLGRPLRHAFGVARRSPPRKVTYFEPVPPRLARNTVIESTFEVGRRFRCTMRVLYRNVR
jgi:hypothetical protein